MESIKKVNNNQNDPLQEKVFTRWISAELQGVPDLIFTDITKDLSNGVILIELAQVLTHKKAPQSFEKDPTTEEQCVKNIKLAFKMFKNDGFQATGITPKDVYENKSKQVLDFVWQLISHYSIENSFSATDNKKNVNEANVKNQLLSWAIKRTQNYKRVFAFKPYVLAMCALLDSYYPSRINYYVLDHKDHQKNFKLIIDVMNELKIPCLIFPDDVSSNNNQIDRKVLLTQLAFVRMKLEVKSHLKEKRRSTSKIQRKLSSTIIVNDSKNAKLNQNNQDRMTRTKIPIHQRPKTDMKNKNNNKSETTSRIPVKKEKSIDFNVVMKPDQLNKEIQKFKENNNM